MLLPGKTPFYVLCCLFYDEYREIDAPVDAMLRKAGQCRKVPGFGVLYYDHRPFLTIADSRIRVGTSSNRG